MKIENKHYYYNNIAWNFITNAFKIQLSDIPKDFYSVMSKCAYFNIHYKNNIDIKIGEPSVSELINKSFPYNILPYTIIKIATVSNYGDILYSNHSGSFFIYYIKKFSTNLEDFIYLCASFNKLINDDDIIQKILKLHEPLNKKVFDIPMINKSEVGFNSSDFTILKNMIKSDSLPKDIVAIFSYSSRFDIKFQNKGHVRLITLGGKNAVDLHDNFNYLAFGEKHHNIVLGIDGYGNSIVYSDKSGSYKIYISEDSNFFEDDYTYLADNLYELLIDQKNIDVLLRY